MRKCNFVWLLVAVRLAISTKLLLAATLVNQLTPIKYYLYRRQERKEA